MLVVSVVFGHQNLLGWVATPGRSDYSLGPTDPSQASPTGPEEHRQAENNYAGYLPPVCHYLVLTAAKEEISC